MEDISARRLVRITLARSCKDCIRRKAWAAGEDDASAPSSSQLEGLRGAPGALSERLADPAGSISDRSQPLRSGGMKSTGNFRLTSTYLPPA